MAENWWTRAKRVGNEKIDLVRKEVIAPIEANPTVQAAKAKDRKATETVVTAAQRGGRWFARTFPTVAGAVQDVAKVVKDEAPGVVAGADRFMERAAGAVQKRVEERQAAKTAGAGTPAPDDAAPKDPPTT